MSKAEIKSDSGKPCSDKLALEFDSHRKLLERYACKSFGCDMDAAEEFADQTICKAVEKHEQFKGECKVSSWLISIMTNLKLTELRKSKNRNFISIEDEDGNAMPLPVAPVQLDNALASEQRFVMERCFTALSISEQKIINYYLDGLTMEEIAMREKCLPSSAKTKKWRAQEKFIQHGIALVQGNTSNSCKLQG